MYARAAAFTFQYLVAGAAMFILGRKTLARQFLRAVWDGSGLRVFRDGNEAPGTGKKIVEELPAGAVVFDPGSDGWLSYDFVGPDFWLHIRDGKSAGFMARRILGALSYFARFPRFFGRRIVFLKRSNAWHIPIMLMARRSMLAYEGKTYEIAPERGVHSIILGTAAVIFAAPAYAAISLLLVMRGIALKRLLGVNSIGYGI
jgi:hypothetical protein